MDSAACEVSPCKVHTKHIPGTNVRVTWWSHIMIISYELIFPKWTSPWSLHTKQAVKSVSTQENETTPAPQYQYARERYKKGTKKVLKGYQVPKRYYLNKTSCGLTPSRITCNQIIPGTYPSCIDTHTRKRRPKEGWKAEQQKGKENEKRKEPK